MEWLVKLNRLQKYLSIAFGTIGVANAYFPVEIKNESGISDENTFLVIKALNQFNEDCFMELNKQTGEGVCLAASNDFNSFDASYRLSELPKQESNILLQLPQVSSGRIYFSYKHPMDLPVDYISGKIIDADGFKPRDSNYYTLYDKIEFTYNDLGTWLNPTAVDNFGVPIRVEQPTSAVYQETGFSLTRKYILDNIQSLIEIDNPNTADEWAKLLLNYQSENGVNTILRFMSPGKAMVQNIPDTVSFDETFFTNSLLYGNNGKSYIDEVWEYYQTHTLKIDISEITHSPRGTSLCYGQVDPATNNFIFTCDNGENVSIPKQTSSLPFFAGAVGDFDAQNGTAKAVIVRELSAATVVGLLPASSDVVLSRYYFEEHKHLYYQNNTPAAQHYDLYGKALHSFGADQLTYTFAYDDALAQDGTLHDPGIPGKATITLVNINQACDALPNVFESYNLI